MALINNEVPGEIIPMTEEERQAVDASFQRQMDIVAEKEATIASAKTKLSALGLTDPEIAAILQIN